jgi:N-acetylmuramoyl-L-alanine amidase
MLALLAALSVPLSQARTFHSEAWARVHFATAERMREALNGRPTAERTRHEYQRVVNSYRAVYLGAPSSSKADPSVVAVAETMVEMGRRFNDDQILDKAIEQYKFLRREYPGSRYRSDGLFTVGEIYKDDLNNPVAARTTFEEFLRHYPHNRLADDAREAVSEIDKTSPDKDGDKNAKAAQRAAKVGSGIERTRDAQAEVHSSLANRDLSPARTKSAEVKPEVKSEAQSARLSRVTGVRHWSTANYTRVAIDMEGEVQFSSQRVATPSRIIFDLRDTKLASTLVGKSFDVEDGFLKKVRVAQAAPGRTRVVLEVDSLSDYDAFLLPNPYRLIIDLHGKDLLGKDLHATDLHGTDLHDKGVGGKPQVSGERVQGLKGPAGQDVGETDASSGKTDLEGRNENPSLMPSLTSAAVAIPKSVSANMRGESPVIKLKKVVVEAEGEEGVEPRTPTSHHRAHSGTLVSSNSDSAPDLAIREARPTSSGDRSLIRALGLKIGKIVIDPGHGGHDTGTIGPNGLEEKDLVLDVSRRLGRLLETRLGAEVVYTRKGDTFIPLETRTAIANQARADLFVSIHANSSRDPDARGVETYYLNFTSSPQALEVAARENAVSEKSIFELQDLVKKIALKEKIEESKEFAGDVQQSLHGGLSSKSPAIRDRGVKKAPFIVLIGANMPSILAEISFVSNPADEQRLATSEYRERIAESLYRGIAKYVNGLSGVKIAGKIEKEPGQ